MKRITLALLAALAVAASGSAGAEPVRASDDAAAERGDARTPAESTPRPTPGCDKICLADEVPIYVPPSRGSGPARIGGGTRGGIRKARAL